MCVLSHLPIGLFIKLENYWFYIIPHNPCRSIPGNTDFLSSINPASLEHVGELMGLSNEPTAVLKVMFKISAFYQFAMKTSWHFFLMPHHSGQIGSWQVFPFSLALSLFSVSLAHPLRSFQPGWSPCRTQCIQPLLSRSLFLEQLMILPES